MSIPAFTVKTTHYLAEFKDIAYTEKNLYREEYEIGHICIGDYQEILKIVYLKDCYNITGHHCSVCEAGEGSGCSGIFISEFFFDNYIKDCNIKTATALFMHELGHFIKKHYSDIVSDEDYQKNYRKKRVEYIKQNKVLEEELEADSFAVEEVGKSAMINAIDKMISVRRKRNDAGMALAIKEFELRKKAISKLK